MPTVLDLKKGDFAKIKAIGGEDKSAFFELGILPGVSIKLVQYAPLGDPIMLEYQDNRVSLSKATAQLIEITDLQNG